MLITEMKKGLWGFQEKSVYQYITALNDEFERKLEELEKQNLEYRNELEEKNERLESQLKDLREELEKKNAVIWERERQDKLLAAYRQDRRKWEEENKTALFQRREHNESDDMEENS